jgi:hypothetical protein
LFPCEADTSSKPNQSKRRSIAALQKSEMIFPDSL